MASIMLILGDKIAAGSLPPATRIQGNGLTIYAHSSGFKIQN
jgi:hypothetical protein